MLERDFLNKWGVWFASQSELVGSKSEYSGKLQKVMTINGIQDFAYIWKNSPIDSLSNYFIREDTTCAMYKINNEWLKVNSISFFKNDIQPQWEHPMNSKGGYFMLQIQKQQENAQEIYEKFLFLILGQSFEHSDRVNGIRFITSKKNETRFRIQIWVSFNTDQLQTLQWFQQWFQSEFASLKLVNKKVDFKNINVKLEGEGQKKDLQKKPSEKKESN